MFMKVMQIIARIKNKYYELPLQARAAIWFLFCSILQKGIAVITTPIFTRILSTDEYGRLSVYNSWYSIISVVITMSLYYGVLTQGIVVNESKKNQFISSLLGLTTSLIIVWFCVYILFKDYWNKLFSLSTTQIIAMFISIWSCSCFIFWSTGERVDYKYKKMVLLTILFSIIRPILEYFVITHTFDKVNSKIICDSLLEFVVYFILFIILLKKGKVFLNLKYWKYAFLFNLPLIPHYLSQVMLNSCDRIMIDKMIGSDEAGIYSLAYSVSTILIIVNTAINSTMEPWLYRKIRDEESQDISKMIYPLFIVIACLNLFLICFAPEAIYIFAPESYHNAIWVIPPIAMSVYFQFTYVSFGVFEFFYKKNYYVTFATLTGALINVVLNYFCIKGFGYYAAGYTTLICYMIFSFMHYIFMKKIVRKNLGDVEVYPIKEYLIISGSFLLIGFLIMFTYSNFIIRYCIIAVSCLLILYFRNIIKSIIKNIISIKGM